MISTFFRHLKKKKYWHFKMTESATFYLVTEISCILSCNMKPQF